MKVAVWDTYVQLPAGDVLHFDIIVPDFVQDFGTIRRFGQEYLSGLKLDGLQIEANACQLCHIDTPDEQMLESIEHKGYYILEMETIPADLPDNPSRRMMILHLRAHFPKYRFADFRSFDEQTIRNMINTTEDAVQPL